MGSRPNYSLIVPSRNRLGQLLCFLESVAETATDPTAIEIIGVFDEDDCASHNVSHNRLNIRRVVVPPGLSMGALNTAGYEASTGDIIMLLNDDVVARTHGWDERIHKVFLAHPDGIVLVHTNDTLMREHLCVFPAVSRTYCELAGGICPTGYRRYRIDDHIEDVFNLLGALGQRRTVYLPDVIFQHNNAVRQRHGPAIYLSDPAILALDAPYFDALLPERKEVALKLLGHIEDGMREQKMAARRRLLATITDSSALRVADRLRIESPAHPRTSANTRVTIGVLTGDSHADNCRLCLDALQAHTENFDLVLLDHQDHAPGRAAAHLNCLLQGARSDFVVLLHDAVLVEPGWLDGLLAAMGSDVGVATPVWRRPRDKWMSAGIAFHPDRSGHYGPVLEAPKKPSAIFSFCEAVLLIDRGKCAGLCFEESYRQYFFTVDFGLRAWERGLRVVCTPAATVTTIAPKPGMRGAALDQQTFERDRLIFVSDWIESGRLPALENGAWREVPELCRLLNLTKEADQLLSRGHTETLDEYRWRAERVFPGLLQSPIHLRTLLERATTLHSNQPLNVSDAQKGHLAWLLGLGGREVMVNEDYHGYRITLSGQFWATPIDREGLFAKHRDIYPSKDLQSLLTRIDAGLVKRSLGNGERPISRAQACGRRVWNCFRHRGVLGIGRGLRRAWGEFQAACISTLRRRDALEMPNPTQEAFRL